MSSVRFAPRRTFFVVRRDGVRELGAEWPEGAVYRPRPDQHAMQFDGGGVQVVRTGLQADVLRRAHDAVLRGTNPRARVGVAVGSFGDLPIYEEVARYLKEGYAPTARELPANAKEVHLKIANFTGDEIEGLANTPNVDRGFDRVEPEAFAASLPEFLKNPQLLFNHDVFWPVGSVVALEVRPEGLWCRCKVDDELIKTWVREKRVRAFSVRFMVLARRFDPNPTGREPDPSGQLRPEPPEIRVVTKAELLEISIVTIPMNRQSLFSVTKGLDDGSDLVCRGCGAAGVACDCDHGSRAVAYRRMPVSAPATPFNFEARDIVKSFGASGLRQACAWTDGDDPLDGSHCLLPHHQLEDGELRLNQQGLRLAMAKLVAADDDLPEDDRRAAHQHLAEHYRELGEEPPALDKLPSPEKFAGLAFPAAAERVVALRFSPERFADLAAADRWRSGRGFVPAKFSFQSQAAGAAHVLAFEDGVAADQCRTLELAPGVSAVLSAASPRRETEVKTEKKGDSPAPEPQKNQPAPPADAVTEGDEELEVPASLLADMESEIASDGPVDLDRAKRVYEQLSQLSESSEAED
jgi:HK97 family phage prohead protease